MTNNYEHNHKILISNNSSNRLINFKRTINIFELITFKKELMKFKIKIE